MLDFLKKVFGLGNNSLKQTVKVNESNPFARMSQLAYNTNFDEVDKNILDAGYSVDRELSNPNAIVFKKGNDEAVIAYRGTNPSNLDDLHADAHIAVGSRKHKRFNEAVDLAKKTQQKYKKVKTTGHSLGGTQALHVNKLTGLDAIAYNPGSGLLSGYEADEYLHPRAKIVKNPNDLIARNARGVNTKHVSSGKRTWSTFKNLLGYHSIF